MAERQGSVNPREDRPLADRVAAERRLDDDRSSDEIKRDIAATRHEMDETLDDLGERLHPRNLIDDVLDLFRSSDSGGGNKAAAAQRVAKDAGRVLRDNPGPALLMAAGAAWAVMNAASDEDQSRRRIPRGRRLPAPAGRGVYEPAYGQAPRVTPVRRVGSAGSTGSDWDDDSSSTSLSDKAQAGAAEAKSAVGSAAQQAQAKAQALGGRAKAGAADARERLADAGASASARAAELRDQAAERAGEWRDLAAERAGEWRDSAAGAIDEYSAEARYRAERGYAAATARFEEATEENPLLVGVGFLAAGLLSGIVFPSTRREDEWMGDASDELKREVVEQGEDLADRGRRAAASTAERALSKAEEENVDPASLVGKARRVVEKAGAAAAEAAREEGVHPEQLKDKSARVADAAQDDAEKKAESVKKKKESEIKKKTSASTKS